MSSSPRYRVVPLHASRPVAEGSWGFDRPDVAASLRAVLRPGDRVVSVYPIMSRRRQPEPNADHMELEALLELRHPSWANEPGTFDAEEIEEQR